MLQLLIDVATLLKGVLCDLSFERLGYFHLKQGAWQAIG